MTGDQLHRFDLRLCEYILNNIAAHLSRPGFADYARQQIDRPVLAHLRALAGDTDPEPLLLADLELADLAETFAGGPLEHDRPWVADEALHRASVYAVSEIRGHLAGEDADEWARASARCTKLLERDGTYLSGGIETVKQWVCEARRLLRALGLTVFLPPPTGTFPTPGCPKPPKPACPPTASSTQPADQHDSSVKAMLT